MAFKKIGALWLKDGKKGKFMSGEIELNGQKIRLFVFKNSKQKENHPDYQIQIPTDEEHPAQSQYYSDQGGNQSPPPGNFDDDIPF